VRRLVLVSLERASVTALPASAVASCIGLCTGNTRRLTLRCTRLATAGFARFRERVNSNVRRRKPRRSYMLIDLVAAKPEDAEVILSNLGHASIWPTLEAKTVDQVKLASLAFILRTKPLIPDVIGEYIKVIGEYIKEFKPLASGGDEGPWIDQLPDELVKDLVALRDEQIPSVAAAWAVTEEAKLDRWNAKDAEAFLRELSAFAASAVAQGRSVLLWLCL
jgi:hypothetical protein